MLLNAINVAGIVCEDSVYHPWNVILPGGYDANAADLKGAYDVVVVRRKDARDTSERWFGVASVESSFVGQSSGQQGLRISNIIEVGEVEFLPQAVSTPQTPSASSSVRSPAEGKWKRSETSATVTIKRRFEFDDESVVSPKGRGVYFDDPNFATALKDQDKTVSSRQNGLSRRAAPVFQSSPQ